MSNFNKTHSGFLYYISIEPSLKILVKIRWNYHFRKLSSFPHFLWIIGYQINARFPVNPDLVETPCPVAMSVPGERVSRWHGNKELTGIFDLSKDQITNKKRTWRFSPGRLFTHPHGCFAECRAISILNALCVVIWYKRGDNQPKRSIYALISTHKKL